MLNTNFRDPCSPHDVAGWESDRFQADVTVLSEMFPTCDNKTLTDYLRMFYDDPNNKSTIINLLLDEHSSRLDQEISVIHEHAGNFQERGSVKQQMERGRDILQIGPGNEETAVSIDIDNSENRSYCSSAEVVENLACGNVQTLDKDVCKRKKLISSKQSVQPPSEEMSCSSETDDDPVFIKSVTSPGKRPFCRTRCSDSVLSSESEESGICIRYKDGAPHPSMKKARKSQIVVIIDDEQNDDISYQSPKKSTNSRCHPVVRESSSACNRSGSSVTARSDGDDDDSNLPELRDVMASGSKKNGTKSNEPVVIPENQVSSSNCVALSNSSPHDDFESLKKVCMLQLIYWLLWYDT